MKKRLARPSSQEMSRLPPRERLQQSPEGEDARLEEAPQQAEHEDGTEDRCSEIHLTFGPAGNVTQSPDGHSERNASVTSTRAARAAGSTDAITATAISTNAETNTGNAPGILTSRKYLLPKRATTNPNAAPASTPAAAITVPSAITPLSSCRGSDPRARRMPNSRVRALTENASTPATPTTAITNATAAKTPNTSEFKRSGVSTSARMSSRVAGRSTGCSADMLRIMRGTDGARAKGFAPV